MIVNDVHSQLNPTRVARVHQPTTTTDVIDIVRAARTAGRAMAIAGGRHAMGGQQFASELDLLDMTDLANVVELDAERGEVEAAAGIAWPALVAWLLRQQEGTVRPWSIIQKQTGADRLTLGGAVSANVHGRVLGRRPIVADVAALTLIDARGEPRRCSREENADLFRLAVGGYGLFGPIVSVLLRLTPRRKLRRDVTLMSVEDVIATLEQRTLGGSTYGDFQFAIDPAGADFLHSGICSVYSPVDDATAIPEHLRVLSEQDWEALFHLAHTDPRRATDAYVRHYLNTDKQVYWSDLHQMADYLEGYHSALDRSLGAQHPGSEMITELYVPRESLATFMATTAADFKLHRTQVIYGTVRLIEKDDESFLAWAREPWACIVFNLHVEHSAAGQARATAALRRLIDLALDQSGSYYLTYHRWATRSQVAAAYPQFVAFLHEKLRHDPEERFQSDWYRHYRAMFSCALPAR